MNILHNTIKIGLKNSIGFLHITDTHFPQYVPEDEKITTTRKKMENGFAEMVKYSEENDLIIIHTGDLMTFCNDENLNIVDKYLSSKDYFIAIGNHDFCHEGGNGDDPKNVQRNLKHMAPHFSQNLYFDSKILNGELNVVTLNNAFFQISARQVELLKEEVAKGIPILLCMHIPLFSPAHAQARMQLGNCAHLLGPSEEVLALYAERYQFHRADETTKLAIDYIKNEPTIKAIVAGHTHMNYEETLEGGTMQFVTARSCDGYARVITIE